MTTPPSRSPAGGRPGRRRGRAILVLLSATIGLVAGCTGDTGGGEPRPAASGPMAAGGAGGRPTPEAAEGGAEPLAAVVSRGEPRPGYWTLPVPPQGPPPARLSAREASLRPEACGACHRVQLESWRASLHARAMGPGVAGQLVDLLRDDPASALDCLTCHAPLSEQRPVVPTVEGGFSANASFDEALLGAGIVCAACHVRGHERFAPPAAAGGAAPRYPPGTPDHGGVTRSAAFERAEFCAACHQFDPAAAVNGKPLQNTYEEWRGSEWGRRGVPCQACHMPGRLHLWKGIHDPEMVRRALETDLALDPAADAASGRVRATLAVTNRGAGHHVPTYVTPTIVLRIVQVDAAGAPFEGTARESALRRDVAFEGGEWVERSDTRLPAGATTRLRYAAERHPRAAALRGLVVVRPDDFYATSVFPGVLAQAGGSGEARRLVARALETARSSPYTAWTVTVPLPPARR